MPTPRRLLLLVGAVALVACGAVVLVRTVLGLTDPSTLVLVGLLELLVVAAAYAVLLQRRALATARHAVELQRAHERRGPRRGRAPQPAASLATLLGREKGTVHVVTHGLDEAWVGKADLPGEVQVSRLLEVVDPPSATLVVLVVPDRARLREAMLVVGDLGRPRAVLVWVEHSDRALALVPRPEWPVLARVETACDARAYLLARFARPLPAREVVVEVARRAAAGGDQRPGRLVVGATATWGGPWPPADPRTRVLRGPDDLAGESPLPPDVVLVPEEERFDPGALPDTTPLAAAPAVVRSAPAPTWEQCAERPELARADGVTAPGVLDERVLNPTGFLPTWTEEHAVLEPGPAPHLLAVRLAQRTYVLDTRAGVNDLDVAALRGVRTLGVPWQGAEGPHAYVRTVAALAMAGVPLVPDELTPWAADLLDTGVVAALRAQGAPTSDLHREDLSVRTRRAALLAYGSAAWRARVGGAPTSRPSVSVLLATRRPEMVLFAARQVAGQVGVDTELVLATHGFELDHATRRELEAVCPGASVVPVEAATVFGDVLQRAVERAGSDLVVKMDDDDWYGPHFLEDLALAQGYSGADLVGTAAEFVFVRPLWTTVRRPDRTECYATIAAGGTLFARADTVRSLGGFRGLRRAVDAGLLQAVRASGGTVYRAHGSNYLLRREGAGHTWDPGLSYFVEPQRVVARWDGFEPPPGVRPAAVDVPGRV